MKAYSFRTRAVHALFALTPLSLLGACGSDDTSDPHGASAGGSGIGGSPSDEPANLVPTCEKQSEADPAPQRYPTPTDGPFIHPGALSTTADIVRIREKVNAGASPWKESWEKLLANGHSQLTYTPNPQSDICAGGVCATENYMALAHDAAAAYQLALRYRISGDGSYAERAAAVLDGWADNLKSFSGDSNAGLRAALYGYQIAIAAELLRNFDGWDRSPLEKLLLEVFYPIHSGFLKNHNGACEGNYWANWDLANMAAIMAIGVFTDRRDLFDEALDYFYEGVGEGSILRAIHYVHPDGSGQWQESGRDQGHSTLGPMLLAVVCEIAWNQGIDLYGYSEHRFLRGSEYVARYNLGEEVPFVAYTYLSGPVPSCKIGVQRNISSAGRPSTRPGFELIANHFEKRLGVGAPFSERFAAQLRPEGGGGDYGGTSGGFDSLGFTTLTHYLDTPVAPRAPTALKTVSRGPEITLSWIGTAGAHGYVVRRSTQSCGPYEILATVEAETTHYSDAKVLDETTYYYVVSALNGDGEGKVSAETSGTTTSELRGAILGTEGAFGDFGATRELAFDGSLRNYVDLPESNGWVGLDLGNDGASKVARVGFAPRRGAAQRMVGGRFEGANAADFSDAQSLFEVTSEPEQEVLTEASFEAKGPYRYLRYLSSEGGYGNVAEIRFFRLPQ